MELSSPKNLNKTSSNFLALKSLIKLFYTLDKTPLGETGCLSLLYHLLAAQASKINFENCSLKIVFSKKIKFISSIYSSSE